MCLVSSSSPLGVCSPARLRLDIDKSCLGRNMSKPYLPYSLLYTTMESVWFSSVFTDIVLGLRPSWPLMETVPARLRGGGGRKKI